MKRAKQPIQQLRIWSMAFWRRYWIGTAVILLATLAFFWPLITHINSYSEGGDAMFNAWTLARDHHCILHQECPSYADGNIYFPNGDSMLYSETQLSTAFVSLPLHWLTPNPLLAYNIMTILSFFLAGWCMYLLAKRLSADHELFSILAGLLFALAPHRMGISHLQNLCIFCLPLAELFILKYFEHPKRWHLVGLFFTLLYMFFASWYQMVFGMFAIGTLVGWALLVHLTRWKTALHIVIVVGVAAAMTLPLAMQYTRFSKEHHASFGISEQTTYSSSLADYFIPYDGTLFGGYLHHHISRLRANAFNPDSVSYHGVVLYVIATCVAVLAFMLRKRSKDYAHNYQLTTVILAVALVGFIVSLGPWLKIGGHASTIPLPYLGVDLLIPQLSFIRAIGRASVLVLFGLCAFLALAPIYLRAITIPPLRKKIIIVATCLLAVVDLLPAHPMHLLPDAYHYNLSIPPVYTFIKSHKEIDNIIVLRTDQDYPNAPIPTARTEDVLWAGYHNRNIFNGYSGYEPPTYLKDLADFTDLNPEDIPKMRRLGLRYVLIDKQLSTSNPTLIKTASQILRRTIYQDSRYVLYQL